MQLGWWVSIAVVIMAAIAARMLRRARPRGDIRFTPQLPPSDVLPRLNNQCYSHGGFMGAAVALLRHPRGFELLRRLTPQSYKRLEMLHASGRFHSHGIMGLLENNPVLAAFGHLDSRRRRYPAGGRDMVMEWDVYLEPLPDHASAQALLAESRAAGCTPQRRRQIWSRVLETTLVAHGSLTHIACERVLGISMHSSIWKETGGATIPRWLDAYHAALEALATTAPTGAADKAPTAGVATAPAAGDRSGSDDDASEEVAATPHGSHRAAGSASTGAAGVADDSRPKLSVFLDVKSSGAAPEHLQLLVEAINGLLGIIVWGVGSFRFEQLRCLGARPQVLSPPTAAVLVSCASAAGGAARASATEHPPARPIYLLSCIGELQRDVARGAIPAGACVLFNGGSLLDPFGDLSTPAEDDLHAVDGLGRSVAALLRQHAGGVARSAGRIAAAAVRRPLPVAPVPPRPLPSAQFEVPGWLLDEIRTVAERHRLSLGWYVQEHHLSTAAASALIRVANAHASLFTLGFNYSNLDGACAGDIVPHPGDMATGLPLPWWARRWFFTPWKRGGVAAMA